MGNPNNVKTEIRGSQLIITIDISQNQVTNAPLSSTGKSRLVASSAGFMRVPGNDHIGLNLNVSYR